MFKIIILLLIYANILFASTYPFTEYRYNDALGRSSLLEGKITFSKNALNINYGNDKKVLDYRDGNLAYMENKKKVEISDQQAQGIIQYFEVLMMLHAGDESALQNDFDIAKMQDSTILIPTGSIKHFISKIELFKDKKQLKQVKLFFKNNDYITISIDDEIR